MNLEGSEVNPPEDEDLALQALQASDPAIGMDQPDLVAIREKIDTHELAEVHGLNDHAARKSRFPRWSYAAAAAVLLVGTGTGAGYSIAALHAGTNQKVVGSAMCAAGHPNCNGQGQTAGAFRCSTSAPTCSDSTSPQLVASGLSTRVGSDVISSGLAKAKSTNSSGYQGRPWLTPANSLSDTPGTGHAYIMSDAGLDRSAIIQKLIDAFNIGEHSIKHNSALADTTVTADNSPATINLSPSSDYLSGWMYSNVDNGPDACAKDLYNYIPKMHANDLKPGECTVKTGEVLSNAVALNLAKEIFGTAGLDLANVTWDTESGSQYFSQGKNADPQPYIQVVAHMTVEGQETSLSWSVEFAPDKSVIWASGTFAQVVQVPNFDTVGAKSAVLRSQDLKWSEFAAPQLQTTSNGYVSLEGDTPIAQGGSAPTDADGRPLLQIQLDQAEITSAEPSIGEFWINGTLAMLPVYKLSDGSRTWTQVSVADKYLQVK